MRRAVLLASILASSAGALDLTYRSPAPYLIRVQAAPGWRFEHTPPYPTMLAELRHERGARLVIAAQEVAPGTTAAKFASDNTAAMKDVQPAGQGPTPRRLRGAEGVDVAFRSARDGSEVRQVYVVYEGIGYVFSLRLPPGAQRSRGVLTDILDRVEFLSPGS